MSRMKADSEQSNASAFQINLRVYRISRKTKLLKSIHINDALKIVIDLKSACLFICDIETYI